jgi:hypothetical protein
MSFILQFPVMLVLISSLLGSFFPFAGSPVAGPPVIDVTGHEGELTAAFLASDTDFYLTANLDPTSDQMDQIWRMVNGWWQDPNVQAKWEKLMTDSDNSSGIDVEEDVFPWLGPEMAVGVRNTIAAPNPAEAANAELVTVQACIESALAEASSAKFDGVADYMWNGDLASSPAVASENVTAYAQMRTHVFKAIYTITPEGDVTGGTNVSWTGVVWDGSQVRWQAVNPPEKTEVIALFGTMNKSASDAFFEKFKAWQIKDAYYEYTSGTYWSKSGLEYSDATPYRGVKIVIGKDYYEGSSHPRTTTETEFYAFTDTYILVSNTQSALNRTIDLMKDGGNSLASTDNFKAAQAASRADRVGMLFANYGHIWDEAKTAAPQEQKALVDIGKSYFPLYYAAAVYFADEGLTLIASYPIPGGVPVATAGGPDLLRSTAIVPEGALMFHSGQDLNATWGKVSGEIQNNWATVIEDVTADGLPPGLAMSDIASLSSLLTWIKNNYSVDINADLFGWMTGEYSLALLPFSFDENGQMKQADELMMLEVADPAAVDAKLDKLFDAVENGARKVELNSVQDAVTQMMQENSLTTIQGVQTATNNMGSFPDTTTTHGSAGVGWTVYHCDRNGDGTYGYVYGAYPYDTSYYWDTPTTWSYTCDNDGTVHQSGGPDFAWDTESIGGVEAKLVPASLWEDSGSTAQRPGWLFLDVGTVHYLVIGSTTDALKAAVDASQGKIASLDESESYKGVLSMLPGTKMSLDYFDLSAYADLSVTASQKDELHNVQDAVTRMMQQNSLTTMQGVQTPTNNMSAFPDTTTTHGTGGKGWTAYHCDRNGDGQYSYYSGPTPYDYSYYWDNETQWGYTCDNSGKVTQYIDQGDEDTMLAVGLIPLRAAMGFTYALGPNNTVVSIGVLYLQPPPLTQQDIPKGTSTVHVAEQSFDLTKLDANIGKCAVKIDVDIKDAPDGASIQVTALDELPEDASSAFELVAADGKAVILDVAYGIRVDKTGLTGINVDKATLTMKVGRNWADAYGTDKIRVFRMSDGVKEVLPTTFKGYEGDYAVFEAISEGGLSTFGLAALKPSDAAFTAADLVIDPGKIKTGKSATVSVTVANSSIVSGTYKVMLKLNGEEADSVSIVLLPGASETVSFSVTKDVAGSYEVEVNGLTGNLVVSKPANWALIGGLIGGGVVAVILVVVGIVLARRRHPEASPSA